MSSAEERLQRLGIELPKAFPPSANYTPYCIVGNVLYLAGHGPRTDDLEYLAGRIDSEADVEKGYQHARLTGLNMLATLKNALGSLDRVETVVKLLGMVHSPSEFKRHPQVINGCSDLFVDVFGESGRHARSAVGVSSLPHGMTVEIEGVFQIKNC